LTNDKGKVRIECNITFEGFFMDQDIAWFKKNGAAK
jgi:hypothetical protein